MHIPLFTSKSSCWCFLGKKALWKRTLCGLLCAACGRNELQPFLLCLGALLKPLRLRPLVEGATFRTAGASLQEGSRRKPFSESFLEQQRSEEPHTHTWGLGLGNASHSCDFLNSNPLASYFLCLVSNCQHWPLSSLILPLIVLHVTVPK